MLFNKNFVKSRILNFFDHLNLFYKFLIIFHKIIIFKKIPLIFLNFFLITLKTDFLKIESKTILNETIASDDPIKHEIFFFKTEQNFEINQIIKKKIKPTSSFFFFSNFNFLFSFTSFNDFYKHNHFYNLYYFKYYKKNFITVSLNKFINRWKNAQNLLFNVYYYEFSPMIFGSFDYKNEILALNWNNDIFDFKFWKFCHNYFIFKINKYGERVFHFYNKIFSFGITFFLISNSTYHYKNLYYFNRLKIFTIGLVSSNLSPWLVSYPIPSLSINNLTEYFFLKLLLFFNKNVFFYKYLFLKKKWFSYFLYLRIRTKDL